MLMHILELSCIVYVCLYGHKIVERTLRIVCTVGICHSRCTSLQYKLIVCYHDNHFFQKVVAMAMYYNITVKAPLTVPLYL